MGPGCRFVLLAATLWGGCQPDPVPDAPPAAAPRAEAPAAAPESPRLRKLTAVEYDNTLVDLFGGSASLVRPSRLEPDEMKDNLLAIGATQQAISPLGVERYEAAAFLIAEQVMADDALRAAVVPCDPAAADCAEAFVQTFGRRAWRRPLLDDEVQRLVHVANLAADTLGDPRAGLTYALAGLLQSPHFIYRVELDAGGQLDAYAFADKLAYFLWSGPPDDALIDAAGNGVLDTVEGLQAEVERLLADPKARRGVRALFDDLLELHALEALSKDPGVFVHYSAQLGASAREETLLGVEASVFDDGGSYLDLFTTRRTFIDRTLAAIYEVPAPSRDGFGAIELPTDSGRRGLLGQVSFLAGQAHAVSTSVTLRGLYVQRRLLCHDIPPPPSNVDTSIPEADADAPTMRERIASHLEEPVCAGCHSITDPTGLAFETYDGIGRQRTTENGVTIDPSGELEGTAFDDAAALADVLVANPDLTDCFATTAMAYANGHLPSAGELDLAAWHADGFVRADHHVLDLLRDIATAEAFRATAAARSPR